jgi:hypothetical protein
MHTRVKQQLGREGAALPIVLALTILGTMVAVIVADATCTRMRLARMQGYMEQAFYLAEAGAERAACLVANGQSTTMTLQGDLGEGSYETLIDVHPAAGGSVQIDLISTGTVQGVSRGVSMRGVRRVSWARYALWYDAEATKLWIVGGETFNGPVYSRPKFHFHSSGVANKGQARFYDSAWTAADSIEKEKPSVNPKFDQGLHTSAEVESMSSISFDDLRSEADIVVDGNTVIEVSGTTMTVTNEREGWIEEEMDVPEDGLVYVRTATTGSSSTKTANVTVSAPDGVEGRLTIVAENDIQLAGHVRCKCNPKTHPDSTDAVGLIAKRHVAVQSTAPNDLEVFAHIICQQGGFGVANYNSGKPRGSLNVYGGIVNQTRNAVGTTGNTGYTKAYEFDPRFAKDPPPHYPTLTDELEWVEWQG